MSNLLGIQAERLINYNKKVNFYRNIYQLGQRHIFLPFIFTTWTAFNSLPEKILGQFPIYKSHNQVYWKTFKNKLSKQ